METRRIKVGVVGAGVRGRWGGRVHLPVFQGLPETEVVALCTSRQETADEAAAKFEVHRTFTDYRELVQMDGIDLVSISVQGRLHHPIALAAFNAGKHVFCEWPLAANATQAEEMYSLAQEKKLHHCLGLQVRCSPEVMHLRRLIDSGYIGKPLTFNTHYLWSDSLQDRTADMRYLLESEGGGSDLLIAAGHNIDLLQEVMGDIGAICGKTDTLVTRQVFTDTKEDVDVTSIDNVALVAEMKNGAMGVIQTSRTVHPAEAWRLVISGTEGKLVASSPVMPQLHSIKILGSRAGAPLEELRPTSDLVWVDEFPRNDEPFNTAQLVRRFVQAMGKGEDITPNFGDGARLHLVLEAIRTSRARGWTNVN